MNVMAIDPGPEKSGYVIMNEYFVITGAGEKSNDEMLDRISGFYFAFGCHQIVCEQIQSFGMPVGKEVFDTVHWCGRFHQEAKRCLLPFELVPRRVIKTYWCKSARATDANIWQAMIDLWGPQGTKKEPGKLYGIKSHQRSALAIAGWKLDALKERQYEIAANNSGRPDVRRIA